MIYAAAIDDVKNFYDCISFNLEILLFPLY